MTCSLYTVTVYDAVTFRLQCLFSLSVPGLCSSLGLAACASNKCLYASDIISACIHRVELTGSSAVSKWSMGQGPTGLTVNSAKNVVVMISGERKLQEFTTHGTLLHTILLQPDINDLEQVTEMTSGKFVISHVGFGTHRRVCLLDVQGRSSCSKLWRRSGL